MLWRFSNGGIDVASNLYQPYSEALKLLPNEGKSLQDAETEGLAITERLRKNPALRIFHLQTRYGAFRIAVNTHNGEFFSLLD